MKTIKSIKIALCTTLLFSLVSCGNKSESIKSEKTTVTATASMQADELTSAGEQLVTPYTFMLADKVFDMALEKDPRNVKAQFYKKFLARLLIFKGIYARLTPELLKTEETKNEYNKSIQKMPDSALKTFLLDGKPDLRTAKDLQDLMVKYVQTISDFRKFLVKNADAEMDLNLNPYVFEEKIKEEMAQSCQVLSNNSQRVEVECDSSAAAKIKINSADLIVLRQMTAGEVLMWSFYTSYSVENLEKVISARDTNKLSEDEFIKLAKETPKLGDLRADHSLKLIPDLAADMVSAAKWAVKYQDRLCPLGYGKTDQRKGFLVKNGVCVDLRDNVQAQLKMIESIVAGPAKMEILNKRGEQQTTTVDYMAIFRNPIASVKDVTPDSTLDCSIKGGPTAFGIFPNGDAVNFVSTKCDK